MKLGELLPLLLVMVVLGCEVPHRGAEEAQILVSQAGRDQELLRLIHGAKRTIYLRTERLTLVPAGNEMAQAVQRGVMVNVELPLEAGSIAEATKLAQILMELGAIVAFKGDAKGSIRGTYLEVDREAFLYSAAPVMVSPPGAGVSFVRGPLSGGGW